MTTFIPPRETKIVTQPNRSKILGTLWSSMGLDIMSELGLIKLSPRLMVNTAGVTNQGLPVAFAIWDNCAWAICGTRMFKSSARNLISPFVEDVSTGAVTNFDQNLSDMTVFELYLLASTSTRLIKKVQDDAGTGIWTSAYTFTDTTTPHKLCYFSKFDRLYFFDAFRVVKSMDNAFSVAASGSYTLTIPYKFGLPQTMLADSNDIWIGTTTLNQTSGGLNLLETASVLRWDGVTENAITQEYKINAKAVLAMCKDNRGIVHIIDSKGILSQFTGDGFEEVGRLPLNREYLTNAFPTAGAQYNTFIHPNGFCFTKNGTFIVNVNNLVGDSAGSIKENLPSGIWEWHKDTGFIHRNAYTYTPLGSTTITDYGQNRVSRVGALMEADVYSESASGKPVLLCGATYYTDASTTTSGIFVDDPLNTTQKYGYFVTSWISSSELKDIWKKAVTKFRKFLDSSDTITVKYRTTESAPVEFSITWDVISSTQSTFTTTTNLSSCVGYEVEVLQGTGSGKCAHIVSVSESGGVYTVVLDDVFTSASGTAKARYQAWKKSGIPASDQTVESHQFPLDGMTERIQVKCCMQFTGDDELHELAIINKISQPLD